ncbi:MAG: TetR/AcrR family transcriptional regulator [Chlorobi bacterium]|nr:TetR/AcrR family transcriptional regulator [Chlorobiota bacterium]
MLTDRQQQIIEESIKLIDSKGIQGFTIKNLSKEIGISEPAIYRHFESKFDILSTILISFKQNLVETQKEFSNLNIDPLERLKMFFNKIFETFTNQPALTSVIFSEEIFQNEKMLCDTVLKIQEVNEKMVSAILKEMQTEHEMSRFVDIETITLMIFGSIRLLVKKWKYSNHSFNLIEKGNNLFNTLIDAIK